ncbi:MAG: exodeoxyribonuclease V subunit beta [Alishewanella agri]|nr:exodeoxyribonuclease V subunit beta [Alishewanella agri]
MSQELTSPLQLPLHGSVLIEASAGTGKTYTIAALYLRFILAHLPRLTAAASRSTPLLPADILVVTFTKAATAELKDRIRQRLVEAAALFRDASASADQVLQALKADFAPQHWPECAYALQMASEAMDEASVKTIHSWCQQVLREHAFNSGSLFQQELLTDLSALQLEAVRDFWRSCCYPLPEAQLQQIQALYRTPEALLDDLRPLWAQASASSEPVQLVELLLAAEQAYQQRLSSAFYYWQQALPAWLDWIAAAEAAGSFSKPRTYNLKKARQDFAPLLDWTALPVAEAVTQLPELKTSFVDNYGKQFYQHYQGEPLAADWPTALLELVALLSGGPALRPLLLPQAVAWCKARLEQQLQQQAKMGFDDIIQQCRRALEGDAGPALAAILRQQYPVAMIDEFQDTDPAQYAIFNAVYQLASNAAAQAVYLIGDPKQAIYAFRGGDIFTYLQARRDTLGRHYTLTTNFRSSKQMVAAVNALFRPAEQSAARQAFLFADGGGNPLPFTEVNARGVKAELVIDGQPAAAALTLWTASAGRFDEGADDSKALSKTLYREQLAGRVADYIGALLGSAAAGRTGFMLRQEAATAPTLQPLQSKDIAILVSTHQEGHLIQQQLRERGMASVYLSDRNSVFDSEVAGDLYLLLQACAEPANQQALLNALYTPLVALPLAQLDALRHDDRLWQQYQEWFYQFSHCWQQRGVLALIRQLVQQFQVAERVLADAGGERYLTDLLHLAELLQQASVKLDGVHALLRYFYQHLYQQEAIAQPADDQIVRLESDAELIQIVTIHKSKGLEYPLVFLPFISLCRPVSHDDRLVSFHNEAGELVQSLTPGKLELATADQERLGEDIRKLYVAVTRAKYATWLSLSPVADWQRSALAYLLGCDQATEPLQLLQQAEALWPANGKDIQVVALPAFSTPQHLPPALTGSASQFAARQRNTAQPFQPWWIASYSALTYGAASQGDTALEHNLLEEQASVQLAEAMSDISSAALTSDNAAQFAAVAQSLPATPDLVSLHDFPRGAGPGTLLHNLLQDAAEHGFAAVAADPELCQSLVARRCRHGSWAQRAELLGRWLHGYLQLSFPLPGGGQVALNALRSYRAEPEFWFAVQGVSTRQLDKQVSAAVLGGAARPELSRNYLNGMLKGFIDLLFEHQGKYYVLDYKSNYLGPDDAAYHPAAMQQKILQSRYELQYVLYSLALHKLLKARLKDAYSYQQHVGGVVYLFLRGQQASSRGAFIDRVPESLILSLEQYFMQQEPQSAVEVANAD